MKKLRKELKQFNEMLFMNSGYDWEFSETSPNEEFSNLSEILEGIIKKIPVEHDEACETKRSEACERLSRLICDDEDLYANYEEALQLLEEQSEIDGSVMADDTVMMWEKVENSFTVDELLSEIGIM